MQVPAITGDAVDRLKHHGLAIFSAALTALCTGEGIRMVIQGNTTDARWGGWYLLAVGALIAFGINADSSDDDDAAGSLKRGEGPETGKNRNSDAVIFFVAAFLFAWALPWVGLAITNGVFVAAYLLLIDKQRWHVAIGLAVAVDLFLVVGLDLLGVSLPTGTLGIGF